MAQFHLQDATLSVDAYIDRFPAFQLKHYPPVPIPDGLEPPPPEISGKTLDDLIFNLNAWATVAGYCIRKNQTFKAPCGPNKGLVTSAYLACSCEGQYKVSHKYIEEGGRMRDAPAISHRTGCLFRLRASGKPGRSWTFVTQHSEHNHEPTDAGVFHGGRKARPDEVIEVQQKLRAGGSVATIIKEATYANPASLLGRKDIYNIRARMSRQDRQGQSGAAALIAHLTQANNPYRFWTDPTSNEAVCVLVTDPMAMALAKEYAYVIEIDATYKTNEHRMPLVHFVSFMPSGESFTVAFAFIYEETNAFYDRLMACFKELLPDLPTAVMITDAAKALINAIEKHYPGITRLQCQWHAICNVIVHCKGLTETVRNTVVEGWKKIIASTSVASFEREKVAFKAKFGHGGTQTVCKYVIDRLEADDRVLVQCYVDLCTNFGHTTTQAAEGAHSAIKHELPNSSGDLLVATTHLLSNMAIREKEVIRKLGYDRTNTYQVNYNTFELVTGRISKFAIDKIMVQLKRARSFWETRNGDNRRDPGACTCSYGRVYGLPCFHTLIDKVAMEIPLEMTDIHPQWHLKGKRHLEDLAQSYGHSTIILPQGQRQIPATVALWPSATPTTIDLTCTVAEDDDCIVIDGPERPIRNPPRRIDRVGSQVEGPGVRDGTSVPRRNTTRNRTTSKTSTKRVPSRHEHALREARDAEKAHIKARVQQRASQQDRQAPWENRPTINDIGVAYTPAAPHLPRAPPVASPAQSFQHGIMPQPPSFTNLEHTTMDLAPLMFSQGPSTAAGPSNYQQNVFMGHSGRFARVQQGWGAM